MWLKCTPLHKIIISLDKTYCEANKLKRGDDVLTCDGIQTIKSIDEIYDDNNVYEIFNVHDNHSYISNGIYSSQCLYLDEFAFRFNRKLSTHRGKLFYRLMQQAVSTPPQPHDVITMQLDRKG